MRMPPRRTTETTTSDPLDRADGGAAGAGDLAGPVRRSCGRSPACPPSTAAASVPNAAARIASSVRAAPASSAHDAPLAHDEDPMREAQDLLDLAAR